MTFTEYSELGPGDPDVRVQFEYNGQTCTGLINARRKRDGTWEAWVIFTYLRHGSPHTQRGWFGMDQLQVVDRP
jgi:hypothetical protein